jgi:Ricin-type beta-trefoil lectin domain/Cellulase (glycosyl hydrolase family 5)
VTIGKSRMGHFVPLGLVIAMLLGFLGLQLAVVAPAQAGTIAQFHGVNWADRDDNFITGPNIPVGLSTADNYSTTYDKAVGIVNGFKALGANTIRFGINSATTSTSWWNSVTAAYDAASDNGMNIVIAPWLQGGRVSDSTAFYKMWDVVINKYGTRSNFYFDIFNEPNGYNATDMVNFEAGFLSHYPNLARNHIIVPGSGGGDSNLCAPGGDSRLNGTLLSIHAYSMFGDSHNTEADWVTDFHNNLCGYGARAVLTEFGVPLTTGVNWNAAANGDRDRSFFYGITDTLRNEGIGSILWTGVKEATQTVGPGPCENASCAVTSLNGSGTNLSLTVTNQSGLDRVQWGWGNGSNAGGNGGSAGLGGVLRGTGSNRCLDVPGLSTTNATFLAIWDCNGGSNQDWKLQSDGSLQVYGNKCLDVPGHATASGTRVEIWDCNGQSNQQWTLKSDGTIVGVESGLCLDVTAPATTNGTAVEIWTCNGGSNQKWTRQ